MSQQDICMTDFRPVQDFHHGRDSPTNIGDENDNEGDIREGDGTDGVTELVVGGKRDQEKGYLLAATKRQDIKDLDEILPVIGEYDRYQILQTLLLSFIMINSALHCFSYYFVTLKSPWRCTQYGVNSSECLTNETIDHKHELFEDRCKMNRSSWAFDKSKHFSMETEFELVCNKDVLLTLIESIGSIGAVFGSWLVGIISDRYGRKPVLHVSFLITQLASFAESFSPNVEFALFCRFCVGLTLAGLMSIIFTILVELAGPQTRAKTSLSIWIAFAVGSCILAVKARYINGWRNLTRLISGPYIVLLLLWKLIQESFRWLRIHQKTKQTEQILGMIAKVNKRSYPDVKVQDLHKEECTAKLKEVFCDAKKSVIHQIIIWFIHHVISYGITIVTFYTTQEAHIGFIIASLVEIPAILLCTFVCNKFGRRRAINLGTFSCAILLIAITFLQGSSHKKLVPWVGFALTQRNCWLTQYVTIIRTICGMLAKFFISLSYYSTYLYSNEIFPTVLRSRAVTSIISIASMGGASAPWVITALKKLHARTPFAVLSLLSLVAGILSTRLEETKDMQTQEIIPRARKPSVLRINKLVDNVRDSYSMCSRASSENRLSIIDQKQAISSF